MRTTNQSPTVKVGVGVMIMKEDKVLLGQRKGAHGEGEYAFPGGHMEFGESFEETAKRETKEETGIEIDNIRFQITSNIRDYPGKHYVHIGLLADWKNGDPQILEPDRIESWEWYSLENLPKPMFKPCIQSIENYKTGQVYFNSINSGNN